MIKTKNRNETCLKSCGCQKLGKGAQLFRVARPGEWFEELWDLGGDFEHHVSSRRVWRCKKCGHFFAYLGIVYKDEEEILVRAPSPEWKHWDWVQLSDLADSCRWRGPEIDEMILL